VNIKGFSIPALIFALAPAMYAQSGKVAVIYLQGAIANTKEGQKASADLEAKTAPKKKEIEQKQSEINALQDELTKGQNTLNEARKNELARNIDYKKKMLQRDIEDAQAELDQDQQRILQQLAGKMRAVIDKYSRDHGYVMVVDVSSPESPVFYFSPSVDITREIIELYDQSAAALSAPAPSAPKPQTPAAAPTATPKPPAGTKPGTPIKPE
jgi:outer membrane protein